MELFKVKYSTKYPKRIEESEILVHKNFVFDAFFIPEQMTLIEKTPITIDEKDNHYKGYSFDQNLIFRYDLMTEKANRSAFVGMTGNSLPDNE